MCHRFLPLLRAELEEALNEKNATGRARVPRREPGVVVPDAYPGTQVPLFTLGESGELEVAELCWGFDARVGGRSKRVFNTRIETALEQARTGKGMWASPMVAGRCLVPVRGFYESWTRSRERRGGEVRFHMPGRSVFLLAGIQGGGRFSVVTTEPNASVSPIHSRMPLVLGPGESSVWLGTGYASLADRSRIQLVAEADE